MNSELRDLYQDIILDHNKNPKNFRRMENATLQAEGHNPLCGDKLELFLRVENEIIVDVSFEGEGCAISKASASLMTTFLNGKSLSEAMAVFDGFQKLVTVENEGDADFESMGKLAVFAGVREYPSRIKCAILAWHTFKSALDSGGNESTISTE